MHLAVARPRREYLLRKTREICRSASVWRSVAHDVSAPARKNSRQPSRYGGHENNQPHVDIFDQRFIGCSTGTVKGKAGDSRGESLRVLRYLQHSRDLGAAKDKEPAWMAFFASACVSTGSMNLSSVSWLSNAGGNLQMRRGSHNPTNCMPGAVFPGTFGNLPPELNVPRLSASARPNNTPSCSTPLAAAIPVHLVP